MKIIMTGGHHSSGLPVIREIRSRFPEAEIIWLGHKHSLQGDHNETLEYKEITNLGIKFIELKAGKVYRNFSISALVKVIRGFVSAYKIIKEINPDVVLSFGGYLAVPVVVAAWIRRIPSVTHEQTLVSGYANRVIGFFAKKILISFERSGKYFNPKKVVFTGLPLRKSISSVTSNSFITNNGLPYIYVTGGKTGSHIINEVISKSLEDLLDFTNVIHQCGDYSVSQDYEMLENTYKALKSKSRGMYFLRKFIFEDEIGEAFSKASLVVSRAGAHITSEIVELSKPCILVPIPWASHNEQLVNALYLKEIGLCEILHEKDLKPGRLVELIRKMLDNSDKYKAKSSPQRQIRNSEKIIVDELLKVKTS